MYIEKHNLRERELEFDPILNIIIGQNVSGGHCPLSGIKLAISNKNIALVDFDVYRFLHNFTQHKKGYRRTGAAFIELIEHKLHPNEQRQIISKLLTEFPKVQFFITTYSPFIVQSAGRGQVISMDGYDLSDVKFSKLSIDEIAYEIMGVESVHSITEQEAEVLSARYLEILKALKGEPFLQEEPLKTQLTLIETQIEDPSIRAFLKMNRSEAEAVRLKKIEHEARERKI